MKALNIIGIAIMGLMVFAVIGSFVDAITNIEAVEVLGGCLGVMAVLQKLPQPESTIN